MCISYFHSDQFRVLKSGTMDFAGQCRFCFAVLFSSLSLLSSSFILTCTAALRHTLQRRDTCLRGRSHWHNSSTLLTTVHTRLSCLVFPQWCASYSQHPSSEKFYLSWQFPRKLPPPFTMCPTAWPLPCQGRALPLLQCSETRGHDTACGPECVP